MSRENVKLFFQKVREDAELQEQLRCLYARIYEYMQKNLVNLGVRLGYDFSLEDLEQLMQETAATLQKKGELDDAELEAVAGRSTASEWTWVYRQYQNVMYTFRNRTCDP